MPAIKPKYDRGIIDTWWYDTAKRKLNLTMGAYILKRYC